ncbi:MATE family efflux transporter [Candidatus Rhodobacter oscarellae]|uniref:MATE family efflux transporter n=1 Tax=Candidatus Rhodobacter oscarellae TaxID=1675527 RepID=UPI002E15A2B6
MVLGLPLIGSHVAQIIIGLTDTLMLGWYSVDALAASALGGMMFFLIFLVGAGFGFAVLPLVTEAAGKGDVTQIRRVTRMGLWISALYGLVFLPVFLWSEPILLALGQEAVIAADTAGFLGIIGFGVLPALFVMVLKNYLAALERTQIVFWSTAIAAVLNAVVNYALIFGNFGAPELGLRGAAIGSVITQSVNLLILMVYSLRVLPEHALFQRIWRLDREGFRRVFTLGWPIGLTHLFETGLFASAAILMGWLGKIPLAAHGVALQLASLTFIVHLGLSQAATVRVGNALSRGDAQRLRDGALVAAMASVGFALLTILVYLSVPEFLMGLFTDPGDPDRGAIIAVGAGLLAMAALFQVFDGLQIIALGLLRGLQDTRVPMIFASVSYWLVGMPCCYLFGFPLGLGANGVWLGLVLGLALAAGLLMRRFWRLHGQAIA